MAFTTITDHLARALGRLRLQFRASDDIAGILAGLSAEVQAHETVLASVIAQFRTVSSATANLLDRLGAFVGAPTQPTSLTDADYRTIVNGQIVVNSAAGRVSDIYALADATVSSLYWGDCDVLDADPAQVSTVLDLNGGAGCAVVVERAEPTITIVDDYARALVPLFSQIAPAGTRVIFCFRPQYSVALGTFEVGDGLMKCDSSGGAVCDNKFTPLAALDRAY